MGKRQTNVELITHLMEFSKHGALMQAFILEGLSKYAEQVKDIPADDPRWANAFVSLDAWKGCADELSKAIKGHYES